MTTTVLALYPPTRAFHQELEEQFGALEVRTIPELRRDTPRRLLRSLRRIRGPVVLAVETSAAEQVLPALRALAALTRATRVTIAAPGRPSVETGRAAAAAALAGVASATLRGAASLAASEWTARRLLHEDRLPATVDLARGMLLLNTSAWIGLSAGGAVSHTVGVANAFAEEGIRVTVATYTETPGLRADVAAMAMPTLRGYAVPPELNRFRLGRLAPRVAEAGLVYERLSLGSTAGAELSRRLGVPLVVEYNGSEIWAARHWGGTRRFERAALRAEEATLRHAHLVVTVSEPLAAELYARGLPANRVVWHPNGVDPERFAPGRFASDDLRTLRARYGVAGDAVLVTFVGTFGAWHGAEVLARVARRAAERESSPLHFLFVGDGARRRQVAELLDGLDDTATMTGAVPLEAIPLHLAASDVLASPHVANPDGSAFFGSPTKLFEYMAAGKAIVASRLDQIAEVLGEDSAVLVRPGDDEDLLRGIDELARDPARRAELGGRARQRVVERYTWTHQVRAILAALERLPA